MFFAIETWEEANNQLQSVAIDASLLPCTCYLFMMLLMDCSSDASCTQIPKIQLLSTDLSSPEEHKSIKYGACRLIFITVDIFKMKSSGPVIATQCMHVV